MLARWQEQSLSGTTCALSVGTLKAALSAAVKWDMLGCNPAAAAEPPRRDTPVMSVLDEEQTRHLLAVAASDDDLGALWTVLATAGLRLGEALALTWSQVSLDDGTLRIVATPGWDRGRRAGVRRAEVRGLSAHRAPHGEHRGGPAHPARPPVGAEATGR